MDREELKVLILNIINDAKNIEEKVEIIIEKYYKSTYLNPYLTTKNKLAQMIIENGEFPSVEKWNEIAAEEGYVSSTTIKYVEDCNWRKLEQKIKKELKETIEGEQNEKSSNK